MKAARFPVHLGAVSITGELGAISAVFAPRTIEATHADTAGALAELASEIRTIADSIDGAARRLRDGKI